MDNLGKIIFIPLLSLLPCIIWLWYFVEQKKYKRPALHVLGITFVLGGLATLPAIPLNLIGQSIVIDIFGQGELSHTLVFLLIVGPVEELVKLLTVYFYAYRRPEFDEPLDGVIFSATAALGFAAAENIVYLNQNDPMLVFLRGPLSNPGHALFSAIWGLSLSKAKVSPNIATRRLTIIALGWGGASLLHSVFDILLSASSKISFIFFALLIAAMIALFLRIRSYIKYHNETSPHRESTMLIPIHKLCQQCGTRGITGMSCTVCGATIPDSEELPLCPVCNSLQRFGAKFCSKCGANTKIPAKENLDTRPHLITISAGGEEQIAYILNQSEIYIGRTLNNAFVIEHPSVSKQHARIYFQEDKYSVSDLDSSNGTFVDGKRIKESALIDGCEVRFGRANYVYRAKEAQRENI